MNLFSCHSSKEAFEITIAISREGVAQGKEEQAAA